MNPSTQENALPSALPRSIAVLGSTGSVGLQALEVARLHRIPVSLLCASRSVTELEAQAREFCPAACAMADPAAAAELRLRLRDTQIRVYGGSDGICEAIAACDAEVAVNAITGEAGLLPTLAVLDSTMRLALANKESLVVAGEIVMARAAAADRVILPVDSEHSAIFQCLHAGERRDVRRIWLTASGGPFFGRSREELASVTVADTLAHPTWRMGKKITVDSATLMNKGFEVIEAVHLFGVAPRQVQVVVHRESILHSAVEFEDGAVIGEMGVPDMRLCIQHALTYPRRLGGLTRSLDLLSVGRLSFAPPDAEAFSLLPLAYNAIERGGALPAALNASNEVAVAAFLSGRLPFLGIADTVGETLTRMSGLEKIHDLPGLLEADRAARGIAAQILQTQEIG